MEPNFWEKFKIAPFWTKLGLKMAKLGFLGPLSNLSQRILLETPLNTMQYAICNYAPKSSQTMRLLNFSKIFRTVCPFLMIFLVLLYHDKRNTIMVLKMSFVPPKRPKNSGKMKFFGLWRKLRNKFWLGISLLFPATLWHLKSVSVSSTWVLIFF